MYLEIIATITLAISIANTVILIFVIRPQARLKTRSEILTRIVSQGTHLAEQVSKDNGDRLRIALDWIRERAHNYKIEISDAEIRKRIEIQIASNKLQKPTKPPPPKPVSPPK